MQPQSAAQLRAALHRERALREVTAALAEHLDEERVLDLAVRHAGGLLVSAYARVWLFDADGLLRCAAAEGFVHARTRERRLSAESVSGRAAGAGVLNLADAPVQPEWQVSRDFGERTGVRAYLGAAIRRAGESLGVLEVMRTGDKPFGGDDEMLLRSLADAVAVAVSNARQTATLRALAADNRRLYRQAQQALRTRDRFLAAAAHELRNPLTRLKCHVEMLLDLQAEGGATPEQITTSLQRMDLGIDRLSRLTSELLNLRPGRGLRLRRQATDLVELVRATADETRGLIEPRLRLETQLPPGPVLLLADQQRLEQVLGNLLDNAAKYSPEGGRVHVELVRESKGVRLIVRDEGIGLPPGAADHIFEPFTRAANVGGIPGLGLGLSICCQIVRQHGGRMWAESPGEGQGTSISLWLPLRPAVRLAHRRAGRTTGWPTRAARAGGG